MSLPKLKYLVQKGTGRIFMHTDLFAKRDDMLPYEGEIPKGGVVDLSTTQEIKIVSAASSPAATSPDTTVSAIPVAPPVTQTSADQTPVHDQSKSSEPTSTMTPGQRFDKIMESIQNLTADDFTKSPTNPMPQVAALNRVAGLTDIEGSEREAAWEEFKKHNPDWTPAPSTQKG